MVRRRWHSSKDEFFRIALQAASALLAIALGTFDSALALDPERPLSQALLRIWQTQQGLPRAAINSICQTGDGYLWLGTQSGLYCFDGVRFVAAKGGTGFSFKDLWIQDVCEDRDHNLWVATDDAGVIRLRDGVATSIGIKEGLPSQSVRCIMVDQQGDVWTGTDKGLARWHDGKFITFGQTDGLPNSDIRALSESPDGTIWIATAGPRLCTWNGAQFNTVEMKQLQRGEMINAIYAGPDNVTWIGTSVGVIRRSGSTERLFDSENGLSNDLVYCLTPTANGGVWAGTKDGVCRIDGDHIEKFQTRDGLSQSTAYSLCEDREGSLWIGTKHGLNQLVDRRTLLPFTISEGLPSNDTGPIVQDAAGNIWVGTLGAGLARFDGRRFTVAATAQSGLPSDTILSLADDRQAGLWIGTEKGLCRLLNGKVVERLTTEDGLPANVVRCLARDPKGSLWIGTSAGLAEVKNGKFVSIEGDASILREPVQSLMDCRGEYVIAATAEGGLYRLGEHQTRPLVEGHRQPRDIDALYVDRENRLWAAIRGQGLALLQGDQFFPFSVKDGLYDNDIFGIVGDDKGQLWMACSRGIFSVPLADLQKFAAGELTRVTSTPFSPTDALRTIECQDGIQPSLWKMQDGRIWFSTIRGVIVVDPSRSSRTLPQPQIVIEEIRVNGKDVDPHQLRHLPPGRTNFEFQYTALSLAAPSRITFRYKLEGFDKNWIDAGPRREAFYTNLTPGSYRFRVQAINSDGSTYESDRPAEFTLSPYFYETRWFYLLVFAAIASSGWLAYQVRIRQIKGRLQAVVDERNRIARELHDTLIQGFSGVTMQLQALTTRLDTSPELDTLNEIIHDAGGCLSETRRSVAGLRSPQPGESGLSAAIAQAARQLTEAADVRLRLKLCSPSSGVSPDIQYNILRIVQEAIANAIKHSGASVIEVVMSYDHEQLVILVRDDGSGFDATELLAHPQTGHYGLIGMRERAAQIDAEVRWRSDSRHGTTVEICLAVPRSVELRNQAASL